MQYDIQYHVDEKNKVVVATADFHSELDKLFDSFYRTDKARTGVAAGSGLGLAITKRIIEQLRGEIWAQATEPQGLTICIRLPMQEDRI